MHILYYHQLVSLFMNAAWESSIRGSNKEESLLVSNLVIILKLQFIKLMGLKSLMVVASVFLGMRHIDTKLSLDKSRYLL